MPKRLWMVGLSVASRRPVARARRPSRRSRRARRRVGGRCPWGSRIHRGRPDSTAGLRRVPGESPGIRHRVPRGAASRVEHPGRFAGVQAGGQPARCPACSGWSRSPPALVSRSSSTSGCASPSGSLPGRYPCRCGRRPACPRLPLRWTRAASHLQVCNTLSCDPRKPTTLSDVTRYGPQGRDPHRRSSWTTRRPKPGLHGRRPDTLRTVFDTRLYETDTLAFGRDRTSTTTAW